MKKLQVLGVAFLYYAFHAPWYWWVLLGLLGFWEFLLFLSGLKHYIAEQNKAG